MNLVSSSSSLSLWLYWCLPKEYRQYEFNELDREEKLKIAFENISLENFRSMLDMYLEKVK